MKEKIQNHKKEIVVGASVVAMSILAVCGMNKAYYNGFQRGCDVLFLAMTKEFPEVNFNDFYAKYHK